MPSHRFTGELGINLEELSADPEEAEAQLIAKINGEIRDMLDLGMLEKGRERGNGLKVKIQIDTDWKCG